MALGDLPEFPKGAAAIVLPTAVGEEGEGDEEGEGVEESFQITERVALSGDWVRVQARAIVKKILDSPLYQF